MSSSQLKSLSSHDLKVFHKNVAQAASSERDDEAYQSVLSRLDSQVSRNTHFMNGSRTGSQVTIRQNQNNTLTLSKNSQSVTAKHVPSAQPNQPT